MKRIDLSREDKKTLWRLFDKNHTAPRTNIVIAGKRVPDEAAEKQFALWHDFNVRNPNPKKHATCQIPSEELHVHGA
jgi:hypothetical protein